MIFRQFYWNTYGTLPKILLVLFRICLEDSFGKYSSILLEIFGSSQYILLDFFLGFSQKFSMILSELLLVCSCTFLLDFSRYLSVIFLSSISLGFLPGILLEGLKIFFEDSYDFFMEFFWDSSVEALEFKDITERLSEVLP